jgi:pilus assembly protein FimV
LATREQFARTGLDRPFVLSKLKFALVPDASGGGHIQITTKESISEPFLNFLVEVDWPQGTVVREYTLLLDPPVYGAAMANTVEQAMGTVDGSAASPAPSVVPDTPTELEPLAEPALATAPVPQPAPMPEPVLIPEPVVQSGPAESVPVVRMTLAEALGLSEAIYSSPAPAANAPALTPSQTPTQSEPYGAPSYGPVSANDTLWSLANSLRPSKSLSIQQTMLAILRTNPNAFSTQNVNSLMAGAVLRVPTSEEIEALTAEEALAEVKRQYVQWDEYRQVVATDVPSTPEGAAAQMAEQTAETPAPGLEMTTGAVVEDTETTPESLLGDEVAEVAPETAPEVVPEGSVDSSRLELLSAGSATEGEGVSVGEQARVEELTTELELTLEQVDSQRQENAEINSRLTEVESLVTDLERLVNLKDDSIAALQAQLAEREAELAAQALMLEQAQAERFESEAVADADEGSAPTPEEEEAVLAELEQELAQELRGLDAEDGAEAMPEAAVDAPVESVATPESVEQETTPLVEEPVEAVQEPETAEMPVTEATEPVPPVQASVEPVEEEPVVAAPPIQPKAAAQKPKSMFDKLLSMVPGNPLYVGGGLIGLLVLVLGLAIARKKRQHPEPTEMDLTALAGDASADELAADVTLDDISEVSLATSEEEPPAVIEDEPEVVEETAEAEDEGEDPLEGVNIYLAYERYDEAADMVRGVIKNFPEKPEYRLRLVEIFYAARNTAAFETAARDLQDVVGAENPMMEKARAWWSEMSPEQALFAPSDGQAPVQTVGDATDVADSGVFDVTEGDQTLSSDDMTMEILLDESNETNDDTGSVDFDLALDDGSETGEGDLTGDDMSIDFEIGEETEKAPEDASATGLDFDLEDGAPQTTDEASPAVPGEDTVDFDVGLDDSQTVPVPMADATSDDDSIEFDLDFTTEIEGQGTATEEISEETMDFAIDLDEPTEAVEPSVGEESGLELVLDEGDKSAAGDEDVQALLEGAEEEDTVIDFSLDADDEASFETTLPDPALEDDSLDEDAQETQFMLRDVPSIETAEETLDFTIDGDSESVEDLDLNLEPELEDLERTAVELRASQDSERSLDEEPGEFETVKLNVSELEDVGALKHGDSTLTELQEDSLEVDTDFADVFDDTGEVGDSAAIADDTDVESNVFDVGVEHPDSAAASDDETALTHEQAEATQFMLRDIEAMSADSAQEDEEHRRTLVLGRQPTGEIDEMQTKLDLAQAYIDMGDTDGARGILGEVIAEGSDTQKQQAGDLLARLG